MRARIQIINCFIHESFKLQLYLLLAIKILDIYHPTGQTLYVRRQKPKHWYQLLRRSFANRGLRSALVMRNSSSKSVLLLVRSFHYRDFFWSQAVKVIDEAVDFTLFGGGVGEQVCFLCRDNAVNEVNDRLLFARF